MYDGMFEYPYREEWNKLSLERPLQSRWYSLSQPNDVLQLAVHNEPHEPLDIASAVSGREPNFTSDPSFTV